MLSKLAWRNAKRSFKDYIIYLITVTLAFSLVFSFNLIISSKDILELTHVMNSLQPAIIFVSFIVLFVIGWLIHYTMKFMLQKRSKEFGTYIKQTRVKYINRKNIEPSSFLFPLY